jgi:hypothetical protein
LVTSSVNRTFFLIPGLIRGFKPFLKDFLIIPPPFY